MTTTTTGDDTDGPVEELEPLFDYSRVQPLNVIPLDEDDSLEAFPISLGEKRKRKGAIEDKKGKTQCGIVNLDDDGDGGRHAGADRGSKDDEDWLAPPPKIANLVTNFEEDQILKELRLKKQELASFAQSAETVLKEVIENAKREHIRTANCVADSVGEEKCKSKKLQSERQKIVISIQDKDEIKQFRVYKDGKLEKLFKMYADKVKVEVTNLVFCFDGDMVQPGATPISLGLEDDDMIEVHQKA